jgi:hypothetical protein
MIRSIRLTLSWIGLAAVAMIVPRGCAEGDMISGTLAHMARLMQLVRGEKPKKTEERDWRTPLPVLPSVELIPFGVKRQRCKGRRR